MQYQRGEVSDKAHVGGMLVAEGITSQRQIARFCEGLAKALSKSGRKKGKSGR